MYLLRGFILLGSLGKVWATTRRAKNVYQSISILAYFKMMNDLEVRNTVAALPTIAPEPPSFTPKLNRYELKTRRMRTIQCVKEMNRLSNGY